MAPLSVRLVEMMMSPEMMTPEGYAKVRDQIPGPLLVSDKLQDFFKETQRKKRILVYFIGGVTFAEIAALRFLNTMFPDKKFIVATTSIINGNSCMQQMRTAKDTNLDLMQL